MIDMTERLRDNNPKYGNRPIKMSNAHGGLSL